MKNKNLIEYIEVFANRYGTTYEALKSSNRTIWLVDIRTLLVKDLVKMGWHYRSIGQHINRDHSSIIKLENRQLKNINFLTVN